MGVFFDIIYWIIEGNKRVTIKKNSDIDKKTMVWSFGARN